jgi:aminopeptidase N
MPISHRVHERCAGPSSPKAFSLAGAPRQYERSRPFSIDHLALNVTIDFDEQSILGTATLTFRRVDVSAKFLELDAVGFDIQKVELLKEREPSRAAHTYDGDKLTLTVPSSLKSGRVRIRYRAQPSRGLYFLKPDDRVPDRPLQVWSQCQDEDARYWFPCHDKPHAKMTLSLTVKAPAGFTVLANGEPTAPTPPKRSSAPWTHRFEMRGPLPSYLVTLVAGHFDRVPDRPAQVGHGAPIPVQYLVPRGRAGDAPRTFGRTPAMLEFFSELTGVPFPWSRYSQVVVHDFVFGGMENTTATTLYEHVLLDERAAIDITSDDLIAHELAHHWFGDYVTCRDWSHGWLNEGFATFAEHLWRERAHGRDEYEYGVAGDCDAYLAETSRRYLRPLVCRDYDAPIDLFDRHLYEKGGLVLHMLRRRLGDEIFWEGVRRYLTSHAHGIVETRDLMRALEDVSGQSLEGFFDQWVFMPGHPVLDVRVTYEDRQVVITVKQTQKGADVPTFELPIEVAIKPRGGKVLLRQKRVTAREDALVVPLDARPEWVAFDPEYRIATSVTFKAPADMLKRQLASGPTARLRGCAARALADRDDPPSLNALVRTLAKRREAWMVRTECARGLGRLATDAAFHALVRNADADHPKVRRAVAAALGAFRRPEAADVLLHRARQDPSYLVEAESCRSLGKTRDPRALGALLELVDHPSWGDVKQMAALDGLAHLRDEDALNAVVERTRYGTPSRGRRAAVGTLARLGEGRRVRELLEDLLDDRDLHLRGAVVGALGSLGDPRARPALRRALERERDGRVQRLVRETLAGLGDGGAADRREVKQELEALRTTVRTLEARLGKVEASRRPPSRRKPS